MVQIFAFQLSIFWLANWLFRNFLGRSRCSKRNEPTNTNALPWCTSCALLPARQTDSNPAALALTGSLPLQGPCSYSGRRLELEKPFQTAVTGLVLWLMPWCWGAGLKVPGPSSTNQISDILSGPCVWEIVLAIWICNCNTIDGNRKQRRYKLPDATLFNLRGWNLVDNTSAYPKARSCHRWWFLNESHHFRWSSLIFWNRYFLCSATVQLTGSLFGSAKKGWDSKQVHGCILQAIHWPHRPVLHKNAFNFEIWGQLWFN